MKSTCVWTIANLPTVAWTGGTPPEAYTATTKGQKLLISKLFKEQIQHYTEYWKQLPNMDTCRIFWNRAQHDAHATIRAYYRSSLVP